MGGECIFGSLHDEMARFGNEKVLFFQNQKFVHSKIGVLRGGVSK